MFIKMLLLLFPRSCLPSSGTGWTRELGVGERARPWPHHRSRGPSTSGPPRAGHPSPQEGLWGRAEPPHLLPVGLRGWGLAAPCLETPQVSFQALWLCKLPGWGTVGLTWRGESPVLGVRFRVPPARPRFSSWRGGGERGQTPPRSGLQPGTDVAFGQGDAQHDAAAQQEPRVLQDEVAPGALARTPQHLGELGAERGLSRAGTWPGPAAPIPGCPLTMSARAT